MEVDLKKKDERKGNIVKQRDFKYLLNPSPLKCSPLLSIYFKPQDSFLLWTDSTNLKPWNICLLWTHFNFLKLLLLKN